MDYNMQFSKKGESEKKTGTDNILSAVKFEMIVKDIQHIIGNDWETIGTNKIIYDNRPLKIMLGENVLNEMVKIIILNSRLCKISEWNKKYQHFNFNDKNIRSEAAKDLILNCRQYPEDSLNFVFWCLLVLAVDKFDYQKRVSFICDFIQLSKINDDELEDIIYLVKFICMKADKNYSFKAVRTKKHFAGLLEIFG